MKLPMLFQSFDAEIDGQTYACYTFLKDATDPTYTVARPKRRGRPVYTQVATIQPSDVKYTMLSFEQLPQKAKIAFNHLGVHITDKP